MGGGLGGSNDQGVESGITNPNTGLALGPWGHKVSNVDITGKFTGFRDFFDSLGSGDSFGFPKTDAREDTGNAGTLLAQGATPGITRQYFQTAVLESFPDNAPGYRVTLTLLGDFLRDQTYPNSQCLVNAVSGRRSPPPGTELRGSQSRGDSCGDAYTHPHQHPDRSHSHPHHHPRADHRYQQRANHRRDGRQRFLGFRWHHLADRQRPLRRCKQPYMGRHQRPALPFQSRSHPGRQLQHFRRDGRQQHQRPGRRQPGRGGIHRPPGHPATGVSAYDPDQLLATTTDQYHRYRTDTSSLPSNTVRDFHLVDAGLNRVWIATQNRAALFDGANNVWTLLQTVDAANLPSLDINAVAVSASASTVWIDSNGSVIASSASGTSGTFTTYTTANGLGSATLNEIFVAADGELGKWLGINFSNINTGNSGLINSTVRAIAQDADGVSRYDPSAAAGTGWTKYQTAKGLAGNDISAIAIVPAN